MLLRLPLQFGLGFPARRHQSAVCRRTLCSNAHPLRDHDEDDDQQQAERPEGGCAC
jgi:hypothetical protein